MTRYKNKSKYLAGLLAILGKGPSLLFTELGCKDTTAQLSYCDAAARQQTIILQETAILLHLSQCADNSTTQKDW